MHNVACIYAELSRVETGRAQHDQDIAMDLLGQAVPLCRRAGDGPTETRNIRGEPSLLQVLSSRDDCRELVAEDE